MVSKTPRRRKRAADNSPGPNARARIPPRVRVAYDGSTMTRWSRFKLRRHGSDVDLAVRELFTYAYRHVPFYRDRMRRAGIDPSRISGVVDLRQLPVTSRMELMAAGEEGFLDSSARRTRLIVRHTTGTTGEPATIYMSRTENLYRRLTLLDAFRRHVRLTLPLTLVDVGPERKDRATKPVHRVGPVMIVRLFRAMPIEEQVDRIRTLSPTLVEGRPSTLWLLACALRERRIRPKSPRMVVSYAEMLYPNVRRILEETFGCIVADFYNTEEIGNIAWQCPKNPEIMHPNPATGWLEAVDAEGAPVPYGTIGRLVVTNLYNHTMPFIRYGLGDRGALLAPGVCSCGVQGPAMRLTEGRDENFLVLPDGREVTPRLAYDVINAAFPYDDPTWSAIDAIRIFQIVQTEADSILVRVVPGPAYSESLWPRVRESVRQLHPDMRLEVELVADLSPEPGRKFHQVLGSLDSEWSRRHASERKE